MRLPVFAGFALFLALGAARADAPRVVASIKPVHSLVAGVMAGIAAPDLIIKGSGSPHDYALKPSDAKLLKDADIIFWIGPLETSLAKALTALSANTKVAAMTAAPGVNVLFGRDGDITTIDGHMWLDVDNAKAMTAFIAAWLEKTDAANAERYRANAESVTRRLDELDGALRMRLAPISSKPFIVYHDAYQYFERRYDLNEVGRVAINPDRPPGARRVAELKELIQKTPAICVFSEPQFQPKLMDMLAGGVAKTGVLDPEGQSLTPGPDLYFTLMSGLGENLVRCLNGA